MPDEAKPKPKKTRLKKWSDADQARAAAVTAADRQRAINRVIPTVAAMLTAKKEGAE